MEQGEAGQQDLLELAIDSFRGVTLKELEKTVQGHEQDVLSTYLGWLQEHLNDWDLSDTADFRPRLESWCASLRFHDFDDQTVFEAFAAWKRKEIDQSPSSARRFLVTEQVLSEVLTLNEAIGPSIPEVEQGRGSVITVRDNQIIDVSSGAEDSDVEFLGWKDSNNKATGDHHNLAANQEVQMLITAYGGHDAGSNSFRARKKSGKRQHEGPLHKDYVCKRCNVKGHRLQDCPTNLDPAYDKPPDPKSHYRCKCCDAYNKHLTTLCPRNRNPTSLTQQRIKAGVVTDQPSTSMGLDRYRPAYGKSRKRGREASMDIKATYTYEDQRALVELDYDDHMNPERRALLEHPRRSSQPATKTGSNRSSHHSPPPAKRTRNQGEGQHERLRERARHENSHMPRGRYSSIDSEYGGSTELLPQVVHRSDDTAGRLSPWDDEKSDSEISQPASSSRRRPVASGFWRSDNPATAIQLLFPQADATWASEMADFDMGRFFDELDVSMESQAAARYVEGTQACPDLGLDDSGVMMEVDEGEGQVASKAGSSQTNGAGSPPLGYVGLDTCTESRHVLSLRVRHMQKVLKATND